MNLKKIMRGHRLIALWALGILVLYAAGTIAGANKLMEYRKETEEFRQAWLEAATTDPGEAVSNIETDHGREPVEVLTGIYVNRISDISISKSGWTADFNIWFRWDGSDVAPGETFQIVNGIIEHKDLVDSWTEGNDHYRRYSVRARLTANIDPSRFPFSDQALSIQVEDRINGADRILYVPDEIDSGINRLEIEANLEVTRALASVKQHVYRSDFSDPGSPVDGLRIHSRFIYVFLLSAPGGGYYFKLFQALFACIAIAFVTFFIKPIHVDPRFGLGVGAFFAAVGNNIYVASVLPGSSGVSLASMINGIGLATIFLTMVQSAISLYLFDTRGKEKLSKLFDNVSFAVMLPCYLVINLVLPMVARS